MFSKILAGVMAVAVLTVGGYAYWQYSDGSACCGTAPATQQSAAEQPSCCQEISRSSCCADVATPCCSEASPSTGDAEVLAIQPREVK
jgi:hypothetical protein